MKQYKIDKQEQKNIHFSNRKKTYVYLKPKFVNKKYHCQYELLTEIFDINYNGQYLAKLNSDEFGTILIFKFNKRKLRFLLYQTLKYTNNRYFNIWKQQKNPIVYMVFNTQCNVLYFFPIKLQLVVYELKENKLWQEDCQFKMSYPDLLECKYINNNQLILLIYDFAHIIEIDRQLKQLKLVQKIELNNGDTQSDILYDKFNDRIFISDGLSELLIFQRNKKNKWVKYQRILFNSHQQRMQIGYSSFKIIEFDRFKSRELKQLRFIINENQLYQIGPQIKFLQEQIKKKKITADQIYYFELFKNKHIILMNYMKKKLMKIYQIVEENNVVLRRIIKYRRNQFRNFDEIYLVNNSKFLFFYQGQIYFDILKDIQTVKDTKIMKFNIYTTIQYINKNYFYSQII